MMRTPCHPPRITNPALKKPMVFYEFRMRATCFGKCIIILQRNNQPLRGRFYMTASYAPVATAARRYE